VHIAPRGRRRVHNRQRGALVAIRPANRQPKSKDTHTHTHTHEDTTHPLSCLGQVGCPINQQSNHGHVTVLGCKEEYIHTVLKRLPLRLIVFRGARTTPEYCLCGCSESLCFALAVCRVRSMPCPHATLGRPARHTANHAIDHALHTPHRALSLLQASALSTRLESHPSHGGAHGLSTTPSAPLR
jgi:hypothetical protein